MTDFTIRVENLSKQYRIGGPQARYKTLRESLTDAVAAPFRRLSYVVCGQSSAVANETIWALKDVSFEVKRGEVVGIPSLRSGQAPGTTGRANCKFEIPSSTPILRLAPNDIIDRAEESWQRFCLQPWQG